MLQPRDYDEEERYGPVQVIYKEADHSFFWKVLASVTASCIVGVIGFIGGATWSHNTRITVLETYRVADKAILDRLERRADSPDSRIK